MGLVVCTIHTILAYIMAVYFIASIVYIVATQFVGTPFTDSLTEEQLELKRKSARTRGAIFWVGVGMGIVLCMYFHPFKQCNCAK